MSEPSIILFSNQMVTLQARRPEKSTKNDRQIAVPVGYVRN